MCTDDLLVNYFLHASFALDGMGILAKSALGHTKLEFCLGRNLSQISGLAVCFTFFLSAYFRIHFHFFSSFFFFSVLHLWCRHVRFYNFKAVPSYSFHRFLRSRS